mgnify:CR=1 FL=1
MFIINLGEQWVKEGMHPIPIENTILIQITDPKSSHVTSPYFKDFSKIYRFKFDDLSKHHIKIIERSILNGKINSSEIKFIDNKQAKFIAEALFEAKINNQNVIVNCQAGISRSGAIAEIATELLGFEYLSDFSCLKHPNLLVKDLIKYHLKILLKKKRI